MLMLGSINYFKKSKWREIQNYLKCQIMPKGSESENTLSKYFCKIYLSLALTSTFYLSDMLGREGVITSTTTKTIIPITTIKIKLMQQMNTILWVSHNSSIFWIKIVLRFGWGACKIDSIIKIYISASRCLG